MVLTQSIWNDLDLSTTGALVTLILWMDKAGLDVQTVWTQ